MQLVPIVRLRSDVRALTVYFFQFPGCCTRRRKQITRRPDAANSVTGRLVQVWLKRKKRKTRTFSSHAFAQFGIYDPVVRALPALWPLSVFGHRRLGLLSLKGLSPSDSVHQMHRICRIYPAITQDQQYVVDTQP